MSGTSSSGGISVNKDSLSLGGASSLDAVDDAAAALGSFMANAEDRIKSYMEAREKLIGDVKSFRTKLQGISWLPDGIKQIVYLSMMATRDKLLKKIDKFAETWQDFGETNEPTEEELKDGTAKPTFSSISKTYTEKLYGDAGLGMMPVILGGVTGTSKLAATYDEYEKKVKDKKAEDDK